MGRIIAISILLLCQLGRAEDILVRLKDFRISDFSNRIESQGIYITKVYELVPGLLRVKGAEGSLNFLSTLPEVLYAERNHARKPAVISMPSDIEDSAARPPIPGFVPRPVEWIKNSKDTQNAGLYQNRTTTIFEKRKFYGSEKVVIAVIDTGVDYTHPDIQANLWRNPGESGKDERGQDRETNGMDDDGNGFIDDVVGWDFIHGDQFPYDDYGHGTHVAGIAAAVGGNGKGISGHCPRCSIMSLKFISSQGEGTDADAIESLEYAAKMGAHVINSSWGGEEFGQALHDAFFETSKMGIINSVAAGNSGVELGFQWPLQYPAMFQMPGLYTVAALYQTNINITFWSNRGRPYAHFSGCGDEVVSTYPNGKYYPMSGTSMAAPGLGGCLALLKSYKPDLDFDMIKKIFSKAILPDPRSLGSVNFGGRPDMVKAFEFIDKLP